MKQIAIVGAGIAGLCHAYACCQRGHDVTVYEQGDESWRDACSYYAGGMLAPYCELESAEPLIAQLGSRTMSLLQRWVPALPQPVYFQQAGSLVVAHPRDQAELERMSQRVKASNLPHGMQECSVRKLEELEPDLHGRFRKGLYFPQEGQVVPRELLPALVEAIRQLGGKVHFHAPVEQIQPAMLQVGGTQHHVDWVLDCRGLAARDKMPELRGVKGEMILIQTSEVQLHRPIRMMHPRYPIYIVPRPHHLYMIGATSLENESRHTTTVRSTLELLSAAYALHPGFAEAVILELNADARPALPNHLPRVDMAPGLLRINGLYRHGYLLGPAIADAVAEFIETETIHPSVQEIWNDA